MWGRKRGLLAKAQSLLVKTNRGVVRPKVRVSDLRVESRMEHRQDLVEMTPNPELVVDYIKNNTKTRVGAAAISLETGRVQPGKYRASVDVEPVWSGIKDLDEFLDGGFGKSTFNIVAGTPGSGKSTVGLQFLLEGINQYDEPALYISLEENKDQFYNRVSKLTLAARDFEKKHKFHFIRYKPEDVDVLLNPDEQVLTKAIEWSGAKRVFIDSLTSFVLLFKNELAARESLNVIIQTLKTAGVTTLASADIHMGGNLPKSATPISTDVVLALYSLRERNVRQRAAQVGNHFFPLQISGRGVQFTSE
jgi:KaiC/GvpD/RAD55 family RecA-like ATPase